MDRTGVQTRDLRESLVEYESTACGVCGKQEFHPIWSFEDHFGAVAIVQCRHCGFHYLNPRPTPETIGIYYSTQTYTPFLSSSDSGGLFSWVYRIVRSAAIKKKQRWIERHVHPGRLLDLGCATGEFLAGMRDAGWSVAGIEPSGAASAYACTQYGLAVHTGALDETSLTAVGSQWNCVTLWHVLEHLHEPKRALSSIRNVLADESCLVIALPNIGSWDAKHYGQDWIALDVPRHLSHFTPDRMKQLLNSTGFEILAQHQMIFDAIFNCLMTELKRASNKSLLVRMRALVRGMANALRSLLAGRDAQHASVVVYFARKKL